MNLLEIIAPGTLKVLGAAPYKWDCFGPNAVYFDAGTEQHQAADKGKSKCQARHWTALGVNIHK